MKDNQEYCTDCFQKKEVVRLTSLLAEKQEQLKDAESALDIAYLHGFEAGKGKMKEENKVLRRALILACEQIGKIGKDNFFATFGIPLSIHSYINQARKEIENGVNKTNN